ncbi:WxL domain-containing protein [Enterococcus faecium]|nr:WxL domain-containing protein [Enterococcus faecium]EME8125134.1 WxL domain-containing protein [Enterococcus faecium]
MKNLLMCGALLATTLSSGGSVFAADYTDATTAKTDAIIQFEKDEDPTNPVDPGDPTKPLDPNDPTNPNGGELMIVYASKLDFGTHKKTETSFNAKADEMKDGTKVTPFISVKDSRGTDRKGWSLTAKQDGAFKDSNGNELTGAELKLSNLFSGGNGQVGAPSVTGGEIVLNDTDQEIALADATSGIGVNSIGLGHLQADETTDGVQLNVPNSTVKNTDQYKTTVTYTLTADPTQP